MVHKIHGSVCTSVLGSHVGTLSVKQGKQKNVVIVIYFEKCKHSKVAP